jgi:putative ABC transport system permease protein
MSFLDRWRHRLRANLRAEAVRRERDAEIDFHLSQEAMQRTHAGHAANEARSGAQREFGNVTATKEDARRISRSRAIDAVNSDLRYALRALRKAPGYMFGSATTLALGIAATTTVFSIFDSAVLRATPYGDPARLYTAFERTDATIQRTPSYPAVRDWLADSATWKSSVEGIAFVRGRGTWVDGENGAERVIVASASAGFFQILRTTPILGRTFRADEETAAGERVAVVSYETWQGLYGGDPTIIGRIVTVDSFPVRLIGVMPPRFGYPQWGTGRASGTNFWTPLAHIEATDLALAKRGDHADSRTVVRLRADSTTAAAALSMIVARLATLHPEESAGWTHVDLANVRDAALGNVSQLLRTLGAAAGLVLLLACVNVANLAFVRGGARAREIAVRVALGAGRARIVRQLLTESVVVAAIGCVSGVTLAWGLVRAARLLGANQMPGAEDLALNATVLAFAIAVSMIAALASAIVPAFRATRGAPVSTIRSGTQSSMTGRGDARIRSSLVVVQLAVALVLLVGTSLLVKSFRNASAVPLGFDPVGVVGTSISTPAKYATASAALSLYQALIERLRALPGVTDAGFVSATGMTTAVAVGTSPPERNQVGNSVSPLYRTTSEGFLRAMKMQMASGHWFTHDDMRERERFVINETLARRLFPNSSPLGQRLTVLRAARARPDFGQPVTGTIIGVLRDAGEGPDGPAQSEIYVPFTLETWTWGSVVARTSNATAAIPLVRDALASVDPSIPEARAAPGPFGVRALSTGISVDLARRRLILVAIGAFAVLALTLAAVGLYSVVSYGVSQRTREVGVRVALGATSLNIVRLILGEGALLAMLGVLVGVGGAMSATQLIATMLFHTTTTDAATYVAAAIALLGTAVVACYIPARRASRLSPTEAIKGE